MTTNLVLQVTSTFDCTPMQSALENALAHSNVRAGVRVAYGRMPQHLRNLGTDTEQTLGTAVVVRVEDWLRDEIASPNPAPDAWARDLLKTRVREFATELGALAYRGTPVWLVILPSTGSLAEEHKLIPLCRTYTNLLSVRAGTLSSLRVLTPQFGPEINNREGDKAQNRPYTPEGFAEIAEIIALEVARDLVTEPQPIQGRSPELAEYLAGLNVKADLKFAGETDREDIDRILRTAAAFSLTGEQPTISAAEVGALMTEFSCVVVSVDDRMDNYGVAGLVAYRIADRKLLVERMSLTCPVLGKQVEFAVISALVQIGAQSNCGSISFHFVPTDRNQMMKTFLQSIAMGNAQNEYLLAVDDAESRINSAAANPGAWRLSIDALQSGARTGS